MPRDLAILAKFDPIGRSADLIKAIGRTDFVFSVYNNDVQFNASKQVRVIEGVDKLVQGILKILLTQKGQNFEDLLYGMEEIGGIGDKLIQDHYATMRTGVIDALAYYNQLNLDNPNADEIIGEILEVKVVRDDGDPRSILIYVSLMTQSGKVVKITVPQVQ